VNIVVRENPNALLVPSSAVVTTPSPHVWTVVDRRLRARAVTIGTRDTVNGRTEITSGLQEGDLVVANPSPDFREGQRVRVEG
jgi:multidrug efflux pump subunit AcrA (membrane-fusion protein)